MDNIDFQWISDDNGRKGTLSRRRYLGLTTSAVVASITLAGCSGSENERGSSTQSQTQTGSGEATATSQTQTSTGTEQTQTSGNTQSTSTESSTETTTSETTTSGGQSSFGPEEYSGSGTDTVSDLNLMAGPILSDYTHSGESNFIIELLAVEGESYNDLLLANEIGDVEGSQARSISQAGAYSLNIDADGDWEVTIEQPANPSPESLPIDESGEGSSYIGPYEFEGGAVAMDGSHDGSSNFIVESVPVETTDFVMGELVFNEVGSFDGSTTVRLDGLSYLNIQADGEWSLSSQ